LTRSAPIDVSSPWPVCTTVSAGRLSSFSLIESMIVGKSLNDRARRAGSSVEQRVAGEHRAQLFAVEAAGAGCVARGVQDPEDHVTDLELVSVRQLTVGRLAVHGVPEHAVPGVQV
jgi:hypothetical protein